MNRNKIILDLCGGTGAWSEPYRKAGYDVRVITLPEFDVTQTQFGTDGAIYFYSPKGKGVMDGITNVHGILAAPPCTMFSIARTTAKTPPDFETAMKVVEACLKIVWFARSKGNLKWWALENPTGYLRQFLGNPPMWFYQWEFGGKFYKRTDIWGYYNQPKGRVRRRPKYNKKSLASAWSHPPIPDDLKGLGISAARAAVRAITPPGFAKSFFKANP